MRLLPTRLRTRGIFAKWRDDMFAVSLNFELPNEKADAEAQRILGVDGALRRIVVRYRDCPIRLSSVGAALVRQP